MEIDRDVLEFVQQLLAQVSIQGSGAPDDIEKAAATLVKAKRQVSAALEEQK